MSTRSIFIYCLVSSRERYKKVWYVGQFVNVFGRFKKHCGYKNSLSNWIRREMATKHKVEVRIIAECNSQAQANKQEAKWIKYFRILNSKLVHGELLNWAKNHRFFRVSYWEFVQYLSQDPAERNDYKLSDR